MFGKPRGLQLYGVERNNAWQILAPVEKDL